VIKTKPEPFQPRVVIKSGHYYFYIWYGQFIFSVQKESYSKNHYSMC